MLLSEGGHDPHYNLALEEYVFSHWQEDILLLWRNDPAVVCGAFQNVFAEVDLSAARRQGIAVVRRFSGGGTVYHDLGNLNYTLILPYREGPDPYAPFLDPVIRALRRLGIPARRGRASDIVIQGRKISGSAQRVARGRHLHHGTLLYRCDLTALRSAANGARQDYRSRGTASVPWPVTNIADETGLSWTPAQFQNAFLEALGEEFPIQPASLTEEERTAIRRLAEEKYRSWEWTFGRSPRFTCRRDILWEGRPCSLTFEAEHGVLQSVALDPAVPGLSALLEGQRLEQETLEALLAARGVEPSFASWLF